MKVVFIGQKFYEPIKMSSNPPNPPFPNGTPSPLQFSPLLSALLKNQPTPTIFGTPSSGLNLLSPFSSEFLSSHNLGFPSPSPSPLPLPIPQNLPFPNIAPKNEFYRPVPTLKLPDKFQKKDMILPREPERIWKISHANTTHVTPSLTTSIVLKTRKEKEGEIITDKLYSSIKYDVYQKITGIKDLKFLLVRIECFDVLTNEVILNEQSEPILSGTLECGITRNDDDLSFESLMKIQFTDVSYHFNKKNFGLRLCYYVNDDLKNPILMVSSPSFVVYARKPNKEKRPLEIKKPPAKRLKRDGTQEWKQFIDCFEEFQLYLGGLDKKDRRETMENFLKQIDLPQQNLTQVQKIPIKPL